MKINEILNEGLGTLIGKGLQKLGSRLAGGASSATQQAAQQATRTPIRPSNIPKRQWKQMTPAQRQAISSPPPAAAPAAPAEPSRLGQAAKTAAGVALRHPVKTAIGATAAYHLAGEKDPLSAQGAGATARKTVGTGAEVVKGFVGGNEPETATAAAPAAPADTSGAAAMPADRGTTTQEPAPPETAEPDNYVDQTRQKQDERYGQWGKEVDEAADAGTKQKSTLIQDIEKNFSNPYVRNAILARIHHESGGRNVGEQNWADTPNKAIRRIFPQLRKVPEESLNRLKQSNELLLNYAYGGKLGNVNPGDGYKYRGRGPIQVTGRSNYERLDRQLGLNGALVKDPDLLLKNPTLSHRATVQFLKNAGADKLDATSQRAAHQALIAMIGGKSYAPGTKLGQLSLAKAEKLTPADYAKIASVIGAQAQPTQVAKSTTAGQAAKPSDKKVDKSAGTVASTAVKKTPAKKPATATGPAQDRFKTAAAEIPTEPAGQQRITQPDDTDDVGADDELSKLIRQQKQAHDVDTDDEFEMPDDDDLEQKVSKELNEILVLAGKSKQSTKKISEGLKKKIR